MGVDGAAEEEDDDLKSTLLEVITCASMQISQPEQDSDVVFVLMEVIICARIYINQAADSHQSWTIRAAVHADCTHGASGAGHVSVASQRSLAMVFHWLLMRMPVT